MQVRHECGPVCRPGDGEQGRQHGDPGEPLVGGRGRPQDGEHNDHEARDQPGDAEASPWHLLGHHPPAATNSDGQAYQRHHELDGVVQQKHEDGDQ